MSLNHVKLGCEGSFMKYLASIVSLIILPQILIWNKRTFRLLITNFPFSVRFIVASCKDLRRL